MVRRFFRKVFKKKLALGSASIPFFLIIGVQKGGTTSLYRYLQQHPQVQSALTKEIHFFDLNFDKGWGWYLEQLGQKNELGEDDEKLLTGEASPYYIFHPLVPERVYRCAPIVKLIVLLRDPVARSLSHYHHERRWQFESLELEGAIDAENKRLMSEANNFFDNPYYQSHAFQHHSYTSRGLYLQQLLAWEKYFSKANILIIQSEFFDKNIEIVLSKVSEFLELESYEFLPSDRHNSGQYPAAPEYLKQRLARDFFEANQQLLRHLENHYPADNLVGFGPGEVNWLTSMPSSS
ncbi:MAG: sulfotransferase domain-containing protein [Cyanophyceae cyanobacterium]